MVGIAAGVALLFASQVASQSLSSSVAQLSHGIVGNATLQLLARDPHGVSEGLLSQVRAIPGVRVAAPLLEASAQASGPKGSGSVELVGADSSLKALGGGLVRRTELEAFAGIGAVLLPAPLAGHLGVTKFGKEVTLRVYGRTEHAPLYQQLQAKQIGGLVASPIVVAPLSYAQELTGLTGRVSRVLVEPAPGREAAVRASLQRLGAGALNVESTSYDEALFAKAASASNQSTALFAVISALVGFLFAFNAMLLTVPQRRRLVADLRREGYTPRTVVAVLLLDGVVLGVAACLLGLLLGEELSIHLFRSNPGYLGSAFAVGNQRAVGSRSVAIAAGGGMVAAIVAVLSPLRDIVSRDPLAAITPKEGSAAGHMNLRTAPAGLVCLLAATAILLGAPKQAILGMILLIAALFLTLPAALGLALTLLTKLARQLTGAVPHISAMELSAARVRAIGVAATGAIAVFGAVAIQGAHADLLQGLENAARDENAFTDLWVSPPGAYNLLRTAPFAPTQQASLEHTPGVGAVRVYRGGLLDWGSRRVWVIAPSFEAPRSVAGRGGRRSLEFRSLLPASQIVEGSVGEATGRLREGGWVVLSQALASEHHLRIGQAFTLPSPVPASFRVAALSTNIGWAPGAITMSAADYARAWGNEDVSAYNVLLNPGTKPAGCCCCGGRAPRAWRGLRPVGAERAGPRRRTERAQPPGPATPDPDRDPDPGRGSARDGRGDRQHGLATPPASGEAQARGLPPHGAVAYDPAREPPPAGRRLPDGRGVRPLRPAAPRPGAGERDQLPGRLLGRGASRAPQPCRRDGRGGRDSLGPRLSGGGSATRGCAGGLRSRAERGPALGKCWAPRPERERPRRPGYGPQRGIRGFFERSRRSHGHARATPCPSERPDKRQQAHYRDRRAPVKTIKTRTLPATMCARASSPYKCQRCGYVQKGIVSSGVAGLYKRRLAR